MGSAGNGFFPSTVSFGAIVLIKCSSRSSDNPSHVVSPAGSDPDPFDRGLVALMPWNLASIHNKGPGLLGKQLFELESGVLRTIWRGVGINNILGVDTHTSQVAACIRKERRHGRKG